MPFETSFLSAESEFAAVVRAEFAGFETPECKLKELFFPTADRSDAAREAAIAEATARHGTWLRGDPTSRWVVVRDADTGAVAGAALWHAYDEDPYAKPAAGEGCTWFAPGEDRDVANALMGQFLAPRRAYMCRPHVFLDICFTAPEYRRMGVGRLLMDWGVAEADRRGCAAYLDATAAGRHLYRRYGFVEGGRREFSMDGFEETERSKWLRKKLIPFEWWPMYRPPNGKYVEGETKLPWE